MSLQFLLGRYSYFQEGKREEKKKFQGCEQNELKICETLNVQEYISGEKQANRLAYKTLIFALGKQYQHVSVCEFGNGNIANCLASQNSSFYGAFL